MSESLKNAKRNPIKVHPLFFSFPFFGKELNVNPFWVNKKKLNKSHFFFNMTGTALMLVGVSKYIQL